MITPIKIGGLETTSRYRYNNGVTGKSLKSSFFMEINFEKMKERLLKTDNQSTGLILRLTTGIVLFPHGAQKMLGWFDGYGFTGTMNFFTTSVNLPWLIAFMVIVIEFVGS